MPRFSKERTARTRHLCNPAQATCAHPPTILSSTHRVLHVLQKETDCMIKKALWIGIALTVFGLVSPPRRARADEWNRETKITFSHPVDVAGHVLVAGTYLFKIADVNDRHIVQISSADGKTIIATVMTIPDYRLTATNDTVIKFREVPAGSPEAVRAWFYPGRTIGDEFVYPKQRAIELARASKVPVPALAVDVIGVGEDARPQAQAAAADAAVEAALESL
jgi:hypothetical protein